MAPSNDTTDLSQPSKAKPQPPDGQWTPESVLTTLKEPPAANSSSAIPFFHVLERLKTTKREGWRRFGIQHGESIADHMYRMAIISMLAPAPLAAKLDLHRCTRMALVHDMAESLVGDITPVDGVSKPEKARREESTMDYLCRGLLGSVDGGSVGKEIREIWLEYEAGETAESRFVHDVDKVELLLQMVEYEKAHEGRVSLDEFAYVAKKIESEEVKAWAAQLLEEQKRFWEDKGTKAGHTGEIDDAEHKKMVDEYQMSCND